jgi:hypothetical protein
MNYLQIINKKFIAGVLIFFLLSTLNGVVHAGVQLQPADSKSGYLARLLINEAPFPGERGWVSEKNSEAAMLAILWVCHGRIHHIPSGYKQVEVAAVHSSDIIDIITAGGERGQCDGFYRDASGKPCFVPRVEKRINYLLTIANKGKPGKFARLMRYAQDLADAYVADGVLGVDRFAGLTEINRIRVTGQAYAWMTDMDYYNPGGNFVRIPNEMKGSLGGNRFFTLKRIKP